MVYVCFVNSRSAVRIRVSASSQMSSAFPFSTPVSAGSHLAYADIFSQTLTWDEAFREFRIHLQATRAQKTQRYYQVQLGGLILWANQESVSFSGFGKRHLDRYLVGRAEAGCAPCPSTTTQFAPKHFSAGVSEMTSSIAAS